tara:strand:- start:11613 stop:11831 length:219 start_codon:yes stop_codon:yes gene_type:complete
MEKKKLKNKAVKKEKTSNVLEAVIDQINKYDHLPSNVEVVGMKGNTLKEDQVYPVTKETAILLINKGFAKLK